MLAQCDDPQYLVLPAGARPALLALLAAAALLLLLLLRLRRHLREAPLALHAPVAEAVGLVDVAVAPLAVIRGVVAAERAAVLTAAALAVAPRPLLLAVRAASGDHADDRVRDLGRHVRHVLQEAPEERAGEPDLLGREHLRQLRLRGVLPELTPLLLPEAQPLGGRELPDHLHQLVVDDVLGRGLLALATALLSGRDPELERLPRPLDHHALHLVAAPVVAERGVGRELTRRGEEHDVRREQPDEHAVRRHPVDPTRHLLAEPDPRPGLARLELARPRLHVVDDPDDHAHAATPRVELELDHLEEAGTPRRERLTDALRELARPLVPHLTPPGGGDGDERLQPTLELEADAGHVPLVPPLIDADGDTLHRAANPIPDLAGRGTGAALRHDRDRDLTAEQAHGAEHLVHALRALARTAILDPLPLLLCRPTAVLAELLVELRRGAEPAPLLVDGLHPPHDPLPEAGLDPGQDRVRDPEQELVHHHLRLREGEAVAVLAAPDDVPEPLLELLLPYAVEELLRRTVGVTDSLGPLPIRPLLERHGDVRAQELRHDRADPPGPEDDEIVLLELPRELLVVGPWGLHVLHGLRHGALVLGRSHGLGDREPALRDLLGRFLRHGDLRRTRRRNGHGGNATVPVPVAVHVAVPIRGRRLAHGDGHLVAFHGHTSFSRIVHTSQSAGCPHHADKNPYLYTPICAQATPQCQLQALNGD